MENNNLFFNLPIDLQDTIIRMNPHPLTDIFNRGYCKNCVKTNDPDYRCEWIKRPIKQSCRNVKVEQSWNWEYYFLWFQFLFHLERTNELKCDRVIISSSLFLCFVSRNRNKLCLMIVVLLDNKSEKEIQGHPSFLTSWLENKTSRRPSSAADLKRLIYFAMPWSRWIRQTATTPFLSTLSWTAAVQDHPPSRITLPSPPSGRGLW